MMKKYKKRESKNQIRETKHKNQDKKFKNQGLKQNTSFNNKILVSKIKACFQKYKHVF